MGKRKKSSKPPPKKKKDPLPSNFACLFCNHDNSVSIKMDKKAGIGELLCKVCGQQFQTGINYLSAGVDVYSDWVDACDSVAKEAGDNDRDAGETGQHHNYGTTGEPEKQFDSRRRPFSAAAGGEDDGNGNGNYGDDDIQ